MVLSRLTKITGPGVSTDTNWVGNNADFTGITTSATSFNIGVTTFHSTLAEVHNIKSTGIITATGAHFSGNVSIAGTLTYEDVTNIDSVGFITARSQLNVGNNIKLGNAGVITATSFVGDGSGLIGVASTDNIVTGTAATFTGGVDINSDLDVDGHTNLDNVSIAGVTTSTGAIDLNADLDVDGHTELDNINIAGVSTFGNVVNVKNSAPQVEFIDTNANSDFRVKVDAGEFRVEDITNGNANRLKIESSGNTIVYGNLNANSGLDVTGDITGTGDLTLTDTTADSAAGPEFKLFRNSASPADADYLGQIKFAGESDTGVERNYAKITGKILDASNGTEDGIIEFAHIKAGSQTITGRWRSDSLQLLNGTALTVAGSTTVTGNIIPNSDSATDIGTNSVRFANIYADTLYGDGSNLTGISQVGGNTGVDFNDNVKARFGTGNDLEIFHNTNDDIINASGSGNLKLQKGGSTKIEVFGTGAQISGSLNITNALTVSNNITGSNFIGNGSQLTDISIASDAQYNTKIGTNAGDSFNGNNATKNTLFGYDAGTAITSGDEHTALGYNALKSLTTNAACVAIGAFALEDCTAGGNVAVGYNALKETVGGQNNVAMGFDAATNNNGNWNIAIGRDAMKANTGHDDNVTIGAYAAYQASKLYRNVIIGRNAVSQYTGSDDIHRNVVIGYNAGAKLGRFCTSNVILGNESMDGASTTVGAQESLSDNIAIGRYALQNVKTNSNNNIVLGQEAAQNAGTGSGTYSNWTHNIAIGYRCLRDATGGSDNMVAIGSNCLEYHTGDGDASSGGYTVAYGNSAMRNNRHIRHSVAFGNQAGNDWNPAKGNLHEGGSTFIGGGAGRTCSTGASLIAIGRDALSGGGPCTGTYNTAIGSRCYERISSGSHNVAVCGLYGGLFVSTGDYNNFFGSLAGYAYDVNNATATGDHNNIFGGYTRSSANNNDHENIFGGGLVGKGANTTYIKGAVYNSNNSSSFSTTSDERIKKNIVDNNTGLDAIEKIRVRNFEYRTKKEITDFDDPASVVVEDKSGVQLGVIAQEIKDILPDVVKQNTTGAYSVNPDNLTWYLVNAVKELSAEVKSLKAQINS